MTFHLILLEKSADIMKPNVQENMTLNPMQLGINKIKDRFLFQLSREVQDSLEELESTFTGSIENINLLKKISTEWNKYFGPLSTESQRDVYNDKPITPSIVFDFLKKQEELVKDLKDLLDKEKASKGKTLNKALEIELKEMENSLDVHNRIARDQYHAEIKRLEDATTVELNKKSKKTIISKSRNTKKSFKKRKRVLERGNCSY